MSPETIVKSIPSQLSLLLNIENIDQLFPGFTLGNFAVLHGSPAVLPLSILLCVRAQLPYQLGGLESNVVFVDGGNTFRLYDISYISQLHDLDPRGVLERIFISRAFTAYQMTSIILDKLQETVEKHNSKLVVISNIAGFYLDKDVPKREARDVFNQITSYLSMFAEENRVIVITTYLSHYSSKQNIFFRAVVCGRASVVVSVKSSKCGQQFALEKHPFFDLGNTNFPSGNITLTRFIEV